MKLNYIITLIRNYKSFRFCLKAFDFKTALRLPIIIGKNVKYFGIRKGCIELSDFPFFGMVRLGADNGASGIWKYDKCDGVIDFSNGFVIFGTNVNITKGFCLKSINGAKLSIGSNFYSNPYLTILAKQSITIGDDCLFGWNITMNDGDGHSVISSDSGNVLNSNKPIFIGNHVWIAAEASILKGSFISNDSIIGYRTITAKAFTKSNVCIVGEYPGRISKENICWK